MKTRAKQKRRESKMKHVSPGAESVIPNEFPLFASSWVALYVILRDSIGKQAAASPSTGSPEAPPAKTDAEEQAH